MKNRVAVTGIGVVSPLGMGIKENWDKIKNNIPAISTLNFPGSDLFPHSVCGTVKNFDPDEYISNRKLLKLMNRESLLASVAAKLAFDDASFDCSYNPVNTGIYLGTGLTSGELEYLVPLIGDSIDPDGRFSYKSLGRKALQNCNPLLSFKILPNMALSYISILFNIKGQNMAFNPWSGNTAQAIGEAMRAIQDGTIDCAVTGGCDSKNHFIGFLTFSNFGLLSAKGISCPFSPDSDGMILSEGAAIAVLENYEMAEKRGAKIYAEIIGYSTATDYSTSNYVSSSAAVFEGVMSKTIIDAGLTPEETNLICSGANSITRGDTLEIEAIRNVFKNNCQPLINFKKLTGDMLAASSAFDFCISSFSLSKGELPVPTSGIVSANVNNVLLNAFELGNSKTGLLIQKN